MKISYNWLKQYLNIDLSADVVSELLTNTGLEVEEVEEWSSVKGGLEGVIIGEVITKEKHPDADKLSVTTVNIGADVPLQIVCGAPNVAAGQKVLVATIGTIIYHAEGSFDIKKSKIRGVESFGMLCAEDELGLGSAHDGIMVLDAAATVGTKAAEFFQIEQDIIFTIGLTPNRADAMSHMGVARDLYAAIVNHVSLSALASTLTCQLPAINAFKVEDTSLTIPVEVEDFQACPRYCSVTLSDVKVDESPAWLKNRLIAIGVRPINNIVDVTNYVLHETGQPLHAFDASKIIGGQVIVKMPVDETPIVTLDGVDRKLSGVDLCICNTIEPMCIAGVIGGIDSGVSATTTKVFLESAYFNPSTIRKTAKRFDLHTDASFRFERGVDPSGTVYALKRAALLIQLVAGGKISSEVSDMCEEPFKLVVVSMSYNKIEGLIGQHIDPAILKNILKALDFEILSETETTIDVSVPSYRVDVKREADVIEEILRIYGYNSIVLDEKIQLSVSYQVKPDPEQVKNNIAEFLVSNGFKEIMCNSLTNGNYYNKLAPEETAGQVLIANPLSTDLNMLRQTLLFGALDVLAYNQNRKTSDIKIFEFGKTYLLKNIEKKQDASGYKETEKLVLLLSGNQFAESWKMPTASISLFDLKRTIVSLLSKLGIYSGLKMVETSHPFLQEGIAYATKDKVIADLGLVKDKVKKHFDIKNNVYYAEVDWAAVLSLVALAKTKYSEVSKFPEVRRDLALLVDKHIMFSEIESIAKQTEKRILKQINLFDIYQGDKIDKAKKSYAVSFIFQDPDSTLKDEVIDGIMKKLIEKYTTQLGAELR